MKEQFIKKHPCEFKAIEKLFEYAISGALVENAQIFSFKV